MPNSGLHPLLSSLGPPEFSVRPTIPQPLLITHPHGVKKRRLEPPAPGKIPRQLVGEKRFYPIIVQVLRAIIRRVDRHVVRAGCAGDDVVQLHGAGAQFGLLVGLVDVKLLEAVQVGSGGQGAVHHRVTINCSQNY